MDDDYSGLQGMLSGGEPRSSALSGIKALLLAVLEDGIRSYLSPLKGVRAEAEDWVRSGRTRSPFSFVVVCETLGLEPDAVRHAVERLRTQRVASKQPVGRMRANERRDHRITQREVGRVRPTPLRSWGFSCSRFGSCLVSRTQFPHRVGATRRSVRVSRSGRLLAACVFAIACAFTAPAHADIDATGPWLTTIFDVTAISQWVQTGSSLTVDLSNFPPLSSPFTGTIDPITGMFSLGGSSICPYAGDTITGTVAPDGRTFTGVLSFHGTLDCCLSPMACGSEVLGTRCGNGVLDPGEQCDDGNAVNGDGCDAQCRVEACFTCAGQLSVCTPAVGQGCTDDGNPCTSDVCDATATCTHPPKTDGTNCSDGLFCNGAETCQGGVCQSGAAPCPLLCDEANQRCVTGCLSAPQTCRTAQRSRLLVKNEGNVTKDKLLWKWTRGAPTSQAEFADPTSTADYALCIFAGTTSALIGQSVVPASASMWSVLSTKGYRYTDPTATADGIAKVLLKGSTRNKSSVRVRGKGSALPVLPLPLTAPVTVQLVNGDSGLCWGASFSDSQLRKNDAGELKARAP